MATTKVIHSPDALFVQDICADETLAPQLQDPTRVPAIKVFLKGEGPTHRKPDISTPRTDVWIIGWEDTASGTYTEIERPT